MRACKLMLSIGVALGLAVASPIDHLGFFTSSQVARAASLPALPSSADAVKYTVKSGDTLWGIADSFGIEARAIQDANGIEDPNSIWVGMVITIPASSPPSTPSPASTRYTVKAGDTLIAIATSHGLSVQAIKDANDLQDPNGIKVGQVLSIPDGGQADPATAAPAPAASATPAPTTTEYTVKAGDNLTRIAVAQGVSVQALKDANNIQDPNGIKVGQTLTIPSGSAPATAPDQMASSKIGSGSASSSRLFAQTGFRIEDDKFWDYFSRRGGVRTFGYPISKEFTLLGFKVQLFQREVMQLRPDGTVVTMNLLDDGMVPYTRMNSSTIPGPDEAVAAGAPKPGSDGYFDKLLAFVKEKSPDQWNGLPVNFYKTLMNTVTYQDAYPDGKQDPGIMKAINLEMWGSPISAPTNDPNNNNFVYLRFQRGIMHYDKTTGATQGLLVGDYLKAIITGVDLPPDLADQAKGSRFYMQYNPAAPNGLNRPADLPGTNLTGAFDRDGLVAIDPGHGGAEIGAASRFAELPVLAEKDLNLRVALRTAELLRQDGRPVQLTRTSDTNVNNPKRDLTGDGSISLADDLEARVDVANNSGAQLFLSIHFNGSVNQSLNGATVYYDNARPFSDKNRQFAQLVLDNLTASTKAAGFDLASRGVMTDESAVGMDNHFYVLGPTGEIAPRATRMVGALAEGAFITNAHDAALLAQDEFLEAVAQGYAQAIRQWLRSAGT